MTMPKKRTASPAGDESWNLRVKKTTPSKSKTSPLMAKIDPAILADLRGLKDSINRQRTLKGDRLILLGGLVEEAILDLLKKYSQKR